MTSKELGAPPSAENQNDRLYGCPPVRPLTVCWIPPVEPTGPKKAEQLPLFTVGPGPGHDTPVKPVFPVWVQPVKSPVSKLPLVTSATAGVAIVRDAAAIAA